MLGYAEVLRDHWAGLPDDKRGEAVAGVHVGGKQLQRLIQELFDAATAEARAVRAREPVAVTPIVEAVAASAEAAGLRDGGRVVLQVETEPVALGDADAIRRVLTNLVHNALEHGSLTVHVRLQARRREVRVHVADRGPGIPAEQLEHLFERRLSDDSPRGRGLPIVDALVRAMGGRVGVRTQVGVGTVFTVTLPRAVAAADPAEVSPAAASDEDD